MRPNYTGLVDYVAVVFTQGGDDWNHLAMGQPSNSHPGGGRRFTTTVAGTLVVP